MNEAGSARKNMAN